MAQDQKQRALIMSLLTGAGIALMFIVLGIFLDTWVAALITAAVVLIGYGVRRLTNRQSAPGRGHVVGSS
ncbi:hypothetical protein ACTMSW_29430 [Micromonospora sp. BQ11]|uniref:hypothetical protein n=1 Tax=Micromonospora sp. BQ11 TaxID=3452212 RepID=UPI003F8A3FF4